MSTGDRGESVAHAVAAFILARHAEGLARSTLQLYAKRLQMLTRFLRGIGVVTMDDITADTLRGYIAWLRESGRHNPGGVGQHYRIMRTWMRWYWVEHDIQERNPIARIKAPHTVEEMQSVVPLADVQAMLRANEDNPMPTARARNAGIVRVLLDSGCRASELTPRDISDWDPAQNGLAIRRSKTRRPRTVFLGAKASRVMRVWLHHRPAGAVPLFCTASGERMAYGGLREVLRRLALKAKVPVPYPHAFRRAFASQYLRDGGDLLSLSRLLGHAGLGLLQRYVASTSDDLRAAHRAHSPGDHI
jgi:site-specific recombinase XerD